MLRIFAAPESFRENPVNTKRLFRLLSALLPVLVALLLLPGLAGAQMSKAKAKLSHRVTDAGIEAALEIKMDPTWHLYHSELGPPDAVGMPTTASFEAEGVTFSETWFPKPHKVDQDLGLDDPTWIYVHEGTLTLFAFGEWDGEAASEVELFASVNGLTCTDTTGQCVPYSESDVASRGAGKDELFANFPSELRPVTIGAAAPTSDAAGEGTSSVKEFQFFGSDLKAVGNLNHRVVGNKVQVVVTIDIAPDWHLYSGTLGPADAIGLVTSIDLVTVGSEVMWERPIFPKAHRSSQEYGLEGEPTWIWTHEGRLVFTVEGAFEGDAPTTVEATIAGSTCSDIDGTCLQYEEEVVSAGLGLNSMYSGFTAVANVGAVIGAFLGAQAEVEFGAGAAVLASEGVDEKAGTPDMEDPIEEGDSERQGLWAFLALCVGGGLFTLLMPCTYPMIPITISFFTKQGEKTGKAPISLSLAYGAGIVLIFVLTGAVFGELIIQFAAHWLTNLVIGGFFVYFALVLLGLVTLDPPRFLMNVAGTASSKGGLLGVFLMGATLVVTSFTCTAPIVGSILSVGAKSAAGGEGSLFRLVIGMGTFGLTMAIPFVVLSMVPGKLKAIPSSGQWMNTLKKTLGFIELAAAFKFFSMVDVAFQAKVMPDEVLLVIWIVLFAVTAAYLFGLIMKDGGGKIGMGRRFTGVGFLALAAYSGGILYGAERDTLMTAFLPAYTNNWFGEFHVTGDRHYETDLDNEDAAAYDRALAQALAEDKLLLVNFTGYT